MAMKYCQPNSTRADRAMARNRFLLLFMEMGFSRRNRIEARRTAEPLDGMTAQQPPCREVNACQRTMALDRLQRVGRTGGPKAAGRRRQRRNEIAVETDGRAQNSDRDGARPGKV